MAKIYENSIFFVDINKIGPNPYQPRREFEDAKLQGLAESIRQYGVLQPLTVSRAEVLKEGGLDVAYELIAGERRLRAARLAGLQEIPVIIRVGDDDKAKLELAIVENLQREDLNPVERARAFEKLIEEFKLNHNEVGDRVGKSRVYVTNTLRLLALPKNILDALERRLISEGHCRPLLTLINRPGEQAILLKEICENKISVRAAERFTRNVLSREKIKETMPEIIELEEKLKESLGTRVKFDGSGERGSITIDFFSPEDLKNLLNMLVTKEKETPIAENITENFTV